MKKFPFLRITDKLKNNDKASTDFIKVTQQIIIIEKKKKIMLMIPKKKAMNMIILIVNVIYYNKSDINLVYEIYIA